MHFEVLGEQNKQIFTRLSALPNFYLAGGTALALQIGHRVSVDFDLFNDIAISPQLFDSVSQVFHGLSLQPVVNNSGELTMLANGIKVTFLHYPFPVVQDLINYEGLKLLAVTEIAATKAYTIGRRGSFKDYVDLYFILRQKHCQLTDIISIACEKYKQALNSRLFLEQLVYLKDVPEDKLIFLKESISREQIQIFFETGISKIKL